MNLIKIIDYIHWESFDKLPYFFKRRMALIWNCIAIYATTGWVQKKSWFHEIKFLWSELNIGKQQTLCDLVPLIWLLILTQRVMTWSYAGTKFLTLKPLCVDFHRKKGLLLPQIYESRFIFRSDTIFSQHTTFKLVVDIQQQKRLRCPDKFILLNTQIYFCNMKNTADTNTKLY